MKKYSKAAPPLIDPVVGVLATTKIVGIGGLGLEVIKTLILEKKTNGKIGDFLTDYAYHWDALGMEVMRSILWNNEAIDDLEYIAIDTLRMPYLALEAGIRHKNQRYHPLEEREIGRVTDGERSLIVSGVEGAEEVCIIAGMGQITGTSVAPAVITIAKELGISVTVIATRPFLLEGDEAARYADLGLKAVTESACRTTIIDLESISRDHGRARAATVKGMYDEGRGAVHQKVKEYLQKNIHHGREV